MTKGELVNLLRVMETFESEVDAHRKQLKILLRNADQLGGAAPYALEMADVVKDLQKVVIELESAQVRIHYRVIALKGLTR